jgi:two-component system response regulator DesR
MGFLSTLAPTGTRNASSAAGLVRVLILDDQLVQREGIARVAATTGVMDVVALTATPDEAFAALRSHTVDLALVDLVLKGERGIAVGRAMRRIQPDLKVIIYTHERSMVLAAEILWERRRGNQPGLHGYVLTKNILSSRYLRDVYEEILHSGHFVDPEVLEWHYRLGEFEALTPREEECALLVAEGLSNREIAACMGVTTRRVENILGTLYMKFRILGEPSNPGRRVLLAEAINLLYGRHSSRRRLRVLVISSSPAQRQRLRHLLAQDGRFFVIGEAASGQKGLEMAQASRPDAAIVHVGTVDELHAVRLISQGCPGVTVLVTGSWRDRAYEDQAQSLGARAYLPEDALTAGAVYEMCVTR